MGRKILVTGGAGYIGSTICSALVDRGWVPIVLDSLVTGTIHFAQQHPFYLGDIADVPLVHRIFEEHPDIFATIHCASRILVPESSIDPELYYRENVFKSLTFAKTLLNVGCSRMVFSSSASVYGHTDVLAVSEDTAIAPSSPYARTKAMVEWILEDFSRAYSLKAIVLRYVNPIGADPKLRTGLQQRDSTHVLPRIIDAFEKKEPFTVTGTDWPTRDGSGLRDYIHVWDLAQAHIQAVERFDQVLGSASPFRTYNLGTGRGTTVLELIQAFERVVGDALPLVFQPARPGDVAGAYAVSTRVQRELGWESEASLETAIASALAWRTRRLEVLGF